MGTHLVRENAVANAVAARARVTFTEFHSPDDPMLQSWARFRSTLTAPTRLSSAARAATDSPPRSGLWRLLATNNRELGRSYLLYPRFEIARSHVERLQNAPDELRIVHIQGPTNGSRGWVILAGDDPVMTCGRWYSSMSTGAVAAAGALAAFRTAVPATAPDHNSSPGRNRRAPMRADA